MKLSKSLIAAIALGVGLGTAACSSTRKHHCPTQEQADQHAHPSDSPSHTPSTPRRDPCPACGMG